MTLTVSRAQSSCCGDHGESGAAVDRAQVVLHVWVDIRVWWVEGGFSGSCSMRRKSDERDIRDNWTTS